MLAMNKIAYYISRAFKLIVDPDFRAFIGYFLKNRAGAINKLPQSNCQQYLLNMDIDFPFFNPTTPSNLFSGWNQKNTEWPKKVNVHLASESLDMENLGTIPWNKKFRDMEDTAALHRFAWLLPLIISNASAGVNKDVIWEKICIAINDWIFLHPNPIKIEEAWHPYTVSERLVNWIFASLACGKQPAQCSFLIESIGLQANYLSSHLEYHGEVFTGNHLSNNGRALYIAGLVLKNARIVNIGRYILLNEQERILEERVFLREGSSHYQFLITRNFCEVLWFAQQCGDQYMEERLTKIVEQLTRGCIFFLINKETKKWDLPLIGDISPDCSPHWLLGVPWVGSLLTGIENYLGEPPDDGWHQLFWPANRQKKISDFDSGHNIDRVVFGREWARITHKKWAVFSHINPKGYPIVAGHAHQDTGGITVHYDGFPLLVDCGRKHYLDDAEGNRGRDCWSHNILVVDNLNPAPYYRKVYTNEFLALRTGTIPEYVNENGTQDLEIRHGGYARSTGVGLYSRKITCNERYLQIVDKVAGQGFHNITLIFHLDINVDDILDPGEVIVFRSGFNRFKLSISKDLTSRKIWHNPSADLLYGWGSHRYGEKNPLCSVVYTGLVELPWMGITTLELEI